LQVRICDRQKTYVFPRPLLITGLRAIGFKKPEAILMV